MTLVNGVAGGFSKSHRGMRQVDPLSPMLFIIVVVALSWNLIRLGEHCSAHRYFATSGCPVVTHLAYADDLLLFCAGETSAISAYMNVLHKYENCSG